MFINRNNKFCFYKKITYICVNGEKKSEKRYNTVTC